MEIIAFFNLKGGVGKTTSAVNIAWQAANEGIPTLLWDLDPQGASSWILKSKSDKKAQAKRILSGKTPVGELVQGTDYFNLDIIPADFSYRHIDHHLVEKDADFFQKLIAPFSEQYSLIVLDCAPNFSLMTEQVFDTADSLYVPIIPSYLSLRTFEQTRDFFKQHNLKPKRLHGFFNMVDMRRSIHRVMLQHPPKTLKNSLKTAIPYAAVVERMGERRAPLLTYDKYSPVSKAYVNLWREIKLTLSEFKS
jgi:cellulose biosynthesis protein BcsQ